MDYVLPDHCLNEIQHQSIGELLKIAKHSHYINVCVRINGEDRLFEADWIKSLGPSTKDAPASSRGEDNG